MEFLFGWKRMIEIQRRRGIGGEEEEKKDAIWLIKFFSEKIK